MLGLRTSAYDPKQTSAVCRLLNRASQVAGIAYWRHLQRHREPWVAGHAPGIAALTPEASRSFSKISTPLGWHRRYYPAFSASVPGNDTVAMLVFTGRAAPHGPDYSASPINPSCRMSLRHLWMNSSVIRGASIAVVPLARESFARSARYDAAL